jgi:hypothetical protein
MKGINTEVIAGIVIIVACILIAAFFLVSAQGDVSGLPSMRDFYYHCSFWSANQYRGTEYCDVSGCHDMTPYCRVAIGKETGGFTSNPNDPDWEACRKACPSTNITPS